MRLLLTVLFITIMTSNLLGQNKYLDKEGYISFFSKAPVEDIEAYNNQVFSLIDIESGELNVQLLVKSFLFEKSLMREHFNENYLESDKFPKAIFKGKIDNLKAMLDGSESEVVINGTLNIRNIENSITVYSRIQKLDDEIILKGEFTVLVADFDIKIPMAVINNIAKEIKVQFLFQHKPFK